MCTKKIIFFLPFPSSRKSIKKKCWIIENNSIMGTLLSSIFFFIHFLDKQIELIQISQCGLWIGEIIKWFHSTWNKMNFLWDVIYIAAEVHKNIPYSLFYASRHQNDVSLWPPSTNNNKKREKDSISSVNQHKLLILHERTKNRTMINDFIRRKERLQMRKQFCSKCYSYCYKDVYLCLMWRLCCQYR